MHWLELWFNVTPDGGDGSVEVGVVALLAAFIGFCFTRVARPRGAHSRPEELVEKAYRAGRGRVGPAVTSPTGPPGE